MKPEWENPASNSKGDQRLDFGHLGGTSTKGDPDSWYPELWDWLYTVFRVNDMTDVGCGIGHAMQWFYENTNGTVLTGIDCQQVLDHHVLKLVDKSLGIVNLVPHDLTTGPCLGHSADLVWCCEVAEHIDPKFVDNIVQTLAKNTYKVLALCAAPRGAGGYHHVNCQDPPYWIEKFTAAGLKYDPELTHHARDICVEGNGRSSKNYFRRSGLIFVV